MSKTKRRMIEPSFWTSESIASLELRQRYLFIGLFSNADDQGRLKGHPALIRNTVYPFDDPPLEQIESDLERLQSIECIKLYQVNKKTYIQILNWWEYQHPQWAYPSELPAPEGWNDRLRYRESDKVKKYNWNGELDNLNGNDLLSNPEPPPDNPPQEPTDTPDLSPKDLGSDLPKALPKSLGKAPPKPTELEIEIESEIELESNDEDDNAPVREEKFSTEAADQKWAAIWNLWTANIRFSESPLTIQEMQCADYSGLPLDWWAESIKIATDNGVYKWAYVRAILDKSRNSRASPSQLSAGGKAKSQKSRDDPVSTHPAIVAYCQTARQPAPIPEIASEIIDVVGNDPKNIELFQKIIIAGIRLSWRPNGVEWMLDHLKRREIPSRQKRGQYAKNGQTSAIPALADRGKRVIRVADPETREIYWFDTRTRQRVEAPA